jgi:hypothetical protein
MRANYIRLNTETSLVWKNMLNESISRVMRTDLSCPRKHLMKMIRWCSSTIQILSAKRLDSESHSEFISSSNDQLRIELDLHAMISNRDHYFDHHFDHHLMSERSQQTRRRDDWVDDVEAMWQRWDQIIVLEDELWLMNRSSRINETIVSTEWEQRWLYRETEIPTFSR